MKDLWFGDRRDRVKWGALVHLARARKLRTILHIAYAGRLTNPTIQVGAASVAVAPEVWRFFSDLSRVGQLGKSVHLQIRVFDRPFVRAERAEYIAAATMELKRTRDGPLLLFLDPDTGLSEHAGQQHAAMSDVEHLWSALTPGDWLAMYQHASRTSSWEEQRRSLFSGCCPGAKVLTYRGGEIAGDVAIFAVARGSSRRQRRRLLSS